MGGGPDGQMGPMGPNSMGPVLNGNDLDGMKNSPANGGPGTPREDSGSGMGDYNLGGFGGPGENVSIFLIFLQHLFDSESQILSFSLFDRRFFGCKY